MSFTKNCKYFFLLGCGDDEFFFPVDFEFIWKESLPIRNKVKKRNFSNQGQGSLRSGNLGLQGGDEFRSRDLDFFSGLDDPEFDDPLLEFGLADDDGEGDAGLLAVLKLVQHLRALLVGLLRLEN